VPLRDFPCRYLGLPLHLKKLRKVDFLPLIEKVGGKLLGWKGKLMSKAARAQLMKSVLTTVVTFHATVFNLPKWLIKKIDKIWRNFYWKGEDTQCKWWWCLPSQMGRGMQAKGAGWTWHQQPEMLRQGASTKMALVPLD
jgi:hypothetical protein